MMKLLNTSIVLLLSLALLPSTSFAAFPDDLSDVVFVDAADARVLGFAETATLTMTVSDRPVNQFGREINLFSDKRSVWRGDQNGLNANAWLFVKINDIWYGATWEFMRFGRTNRSAGALVGPRHLRFPPLNNFQRTRGEIYGFMVAGITRNGVNPNVRERSNVTFYRWGEGPVDVSEVFPPAEPESNVAAVAPAVQLLLDEGQSIPIPPPVAPPVSPQTSE